MFIEMCVMIWGREAAGAGWGGGYGTTKAS